MKVFSAKTPDEDRPFAIGFKHRLLVGEFIQSVTSVVVVVHRGTDVSPNAILHGAAQVSVSGLDVLQQLQGGLDEVDYLLIVTVLTTLGNTRAGFVILPVRAIVYE